jgi:hypothetical protein
MQVLLEGIAALIMVGVLTVAFDALLRGRGRGRLRRLPYRRREYLLTQAERAFYDVLCRAVGDDLRIFAQVRLADLIYVPKEARDRQSHVSRITSKHVDFVLCHGATMEPLLAVELDDASHRLAHRRERDRFVDAAFDAAGLPLLRVPVQRAYDTAILAAQIAEYVPMPAARPRRVGRR